MDSSKALDVFAKVAASYTRRELDRRGYDLLMATRFGRLSKTLTSRQKYALEFVCYAASALGLDRLQGGGPFGSYLRDVLLDIPSELARRMINGSESLDFGSEEFAQVIDLMTDDDLEHVVAFGLLPTPKAENETGGSDRAPMAGKVGSVEDLVLEATRFVESLRAKRRKRTGEIE